MTDTNPSSNLETIRDVLSNLSRYEESRREAMRGLEALEHLTPGTPLRDAEHALACIAAVTPEDSDVGRYARNYFRKQSKTPPITADETTAQQFTAFELLSGSKWVLDKSKPPVRVILAPGETWLPEEPTPPHPGPSIEKAFAQSPRRLRTGVAALVDETYVLPPPEKASGDLVPDSLRKAQDVYRHGVRATGHGPQCMCEICQDERSGSGNC